MQPPYAAATHHSCVEGHSTMTCHKAEFLNLPSQDPKATRPHQRVTIMPQGIKILTIWSQDQATRLHYHAAIPFTLQDEGEC
eukprot:2508205-Amphidinium_carterae.1